MVQQVDDPVAVSGDLGGREVTLPGVAGWGSLGLRFGTFLPVDLPATPLRDGMVD